MPSSTQGLITTTTNNTTITSTTTTTNTTSDYIPHSQFNNSIPTVNNNLSSSNIQNDSTDLFQKSSIQPEQQNQSNETINGGHTIQRLTILPPQIHYNASVSQAHNTDKSSPHPHHQTLPQFTSPATEVPTTATEQRMGALSGTFNSDRVTLTEATGTTMAVTATSQPSVSNRNHQSWIMHNSPHVDEQSHVGTGPTYNFPFGHGTGTKNRSDNGFNRIDDGFSNLNANTHHQLSSPPPPTPPPNILNRDIFLNNSRVNSNFLNSHTHRNGVPHSKYSDTTHVTTTAADIVSEMNQIYKQSMFMRRTAPDDDLNPFNSNIPLHRESTLNRIGNLYCSIINFK